MNFSSHVRHKKTDQNNSQHLKTINIQSKSPLMNLTGGKKLVDFLANLPSPSIMVLTDTLNRHKAKAFAKMKKGESISDEKALDTAMKAGK